MLPAKPTSRPARRSISNSSEVVVVFPFEPVIHIILPLEYRAANSISEIIGIPWFMSCWMIGAFSGMPGDLITSSAFRIRSALCFPSSQAM